MAAVEIDRYQARSAGGIVYTIIEYQNILEMQMLDGNVSRTKGTRFLHLSNGCHVNYIDDDTFMIVETDEIVRRVR